MALAGPVGGAAGQFLLSLLLVRQLDPAGFGRFSFLMVAIQLAWGVWGALFCAALPTLFAGLDRAGIARVRTQIAAAHLPALVLATGLVALLGWGVGMDGPATAVFAAFAAASLVRWYARAEAYARGRQALTATSDGIYTVILVAGVAAMAIGWARGLVAAGAILGWASAASLMPFGAGFARVQFVLPRLDAWRGYLAIWRDHARWALFGVATTEATANAHAYCVTALMGPDAFAPIAAGALAIRPVMVAMNALTDYERARMAGAIAQGRIDTARSAVRFFRWVLIAIWVATAVLLAGVLTVAPHVLFPHYPLAVVGSAAAAWMAVAAVRLARMPESALLQAGGAFRTLALASGWSSVASVVAVLALIVAGGPLWSVLGVLAGELLFAVAIWRRAAVWLRARDGAHRSRAAISPSR